MKQNDNTPVENPDARLVKLCLAGDQRAYTQLLNRYKNRIFSYIYRLVRTPVDAEDITQETFIRAFKALGTYDPNLPFSSWLFRISHNLAVDFFRRHSKAFTEPLSEDLTGLKTCFYDKSGPAEGYEQQRQKEIIEQAIFKLSVEYREVLLLYHREGKTYEELARILDLPLGTVKTRLHRAREKLKEELLKVKHLLPQIRNK